MNSTVDDAARAPLLKLLSDTHETREALAALLNEETRLLRAGALKEALALTPDKAALTLAHTRATHAIRHHAVALHRHARVETVELRERERDLLKAAEINVRLLSTLRTALDGVMRQALNTPQGPASPYARSGMMATQKQPDHRLLSVTS